MDSKVFSGWLEDVMCACEEIQEAGYCENCPMRGTCLENASIKEIAYDTPREHFDEIVEMGKDPRLYILGGYEREEVLYMNR